MDSNSETIIATEKSHQIEMVSNEHKDEDKETNTDPTADVLTESLINCDLVVAEAIGSENKFEFSESPTLEQIREMHAKFTTDRNWDQFHTPRNVLLALVAEMGELAELFQWKNECEVGLKEWTPKEKKALEEELSDCLIYLVRLADRCRVDLPAAVVDKLAKNDNKYPISKAFGSSKKYTEYE